MARFSEKYGYTALSSVLIREQMPKEIINVICTCYDLLKNAMRPNHGRAYEDMEKHLWCYFFNKRLDDFYREFGGGSIVATWYLESDEIAWYQKLDLVEATIKYFNDTSTSIYDDYNKFRGFIVDYLNSEFKRLNFAYSIIDNQIVEITSKEEIDAIETALQNPSNGVKEHLHTALDLLSNRPEGDYRNSIKESISAVEATVREITGAKTLNFSELERKHIILPPVLKQSFEKLYGYTNDATTGIRHALMDDANAPSADEAIFMLVSCSAFINYLAKKRT